LKEKKLNTNITLVFLSLLSLEEEDSFKVLEIPFARDQHDLRKLSEKEFDLYLTSQRESVIFKSTSSVNIFGTIFRSLILAAVT